MRAIVCGLVLCVASVAYAATCPADCDSNRAVTVDEVVRAVSIALGDTSVTACGAADSDFDGTVTVNEIVAGVTALLGECPPQAACPFVFGDNTGNEVCEYDGLLGGSCHLTFDWQSDGRVVSILLHTDPAIEILADVDPATPAAGKRADVFGFYFGSDPRLYSYLGTAHIDGPSVFRLRGNFFPVDVGECTRWRDLHGTSR